MIFVKDNCMFQVQESKIMQKTNTLVTGITLSDLDSIMISMVRLTDLVRHVSLQQAVVLLLCLKPV